jgi:hypothetical protein
MPVEVEVDRLLTPVDKLLMRLVAVLSPVEVDVVSDVKLLFVVLS